MTSLTISKSKNKKHTKITLIGKVPDLIYSKDTVYSLNNFKTDMAQQHTHFTFTTIKMQNTSTTPLSLKLL